MTLQDRLTRPAESEERPEHTPSVAQPIAPAHSQGPWNSPYKGLVPYEIEDEPFFFGRSLDRKILAANLRSSRLTLVYGASGVGKSSLLRAGVAADLEAQALRNLARRHSVGAALLIFSTWKDDPVVGLIAALDQLAARFNPRGPVSPALAPGTPGSLLDAIRRTSERLQGDCLIMLDQFEEYFVYHDREDAEDSFARELPRVLDEPGVPAHFLIAMREDALANLDQFKQRIPGLFENRFRIEHLTREQGRAAIVEPLERWWELRHQRVRAEPALVDRVLADVWAGRDYFQAETGAPGESVAPGDGPAGTSWHIEAPFLQLVMEYVWNQEAATVEPGQPFALRLETLTTTLKGVTQIVRQYTHGKMDHLPPEQQELAAQAIKFLVTPTGGKIAYALGDLASLIEVPPQQVRDLVANLEGDARILRRAGPAPGRHDPEGMRYEIFHDALATSLLDWRRQYLAQQQLKRARIKDRQRLRTLLGRGAIVAFLGLVVAAVVVSTQINSANTAAWEAGLERAAALTQAQAANAEAALAQSEAAQAQAEATRAQADAARASAEAAQRAAEAKVAEARTIIQQQDRSIPHLRAVMRGHTGIVNSAVFSRDGRRVLTASADGSARLWEADTGNPLIEFAEHTDAIGAAVNMAAFSPDGSRVATAGADGTTRIWTSDGRLIAKLVEPLAIRTAAFSPDGSRVLTLAADGTARVWDPVTGRLVLTLTEQGGISAALFSPDGSQVVIAAADGTLPIRDASSGDQIGALRGHTARALVMVFSQDGRYLASKAADGTARVWDVRTATPVRTLTGLDPSAAALAFSSDATLLATNGSRAQDATIWDLATGDKRDLIGHQASVDSISFSPDGSQVATSSQDESAFIWKVSDGSQALALGGHANPVGNVLFSPDSLFVLTTSTDRTARVWEATNAGQDRNRITELRGHTQAVTTIVFAASSAATPGSQLVVTASEDNTARIWDASTGSLLWTLTGHSGAVTGAEFSPDGTRVVTASADQTARIWDVATGKQLLTLIGHTGIVGSARFSPDGRYVVTASRDGSARVWNATTGQEVGPPLLHVPTCSPMPTCLVGGVNSARFSQDSAHIVTAGVDGNVAVWQTSDGARVALLIGHTAPVDSASFSPDDKRIVSRSSDRTVRIWDAASGQPLLALTALTGHIYNATFSYAGDLVVTSDDGGARVWNAATGALVSEFRGHTGPVYRARFSPNDAFVVTASADHTAAVWKAGTGQPVRILSGHSDAVNSVEFSPSGDAVATASDDGTARIWGLPEVSAE
jgi:WD40 repeat protein